MGYQGKIAVVTGSSKGLGRAIVLRLASLGANVVVNYSKDKVAADEVVAAAEKSGGQGTPCSGRCVERQ